MNIGKLCFPTGSVYEGEFKDNSFDGKGKYTWPNGKREKIFL
jgi:hypothetical protein